ncbi:MAG: leucine-rich repeat protein [Treponema sp.]|nr:leucine-rich repeat protein [Treponema sp.]
MKKRLTILLFVCLVLVTLSYAVWKFVFPHDKAIDLDRIESLISEGTIEAAIDGKRVSFIDGNFTSQTVTDSSEAASVLNSASTLFGDSFHADAEDFISQPYDDGEFQANYYRYSPSVNGVRVLGSQIILSADRDSNVDALFSSYVPSIESVDTDAKITPEEAKANAIKFLMAGEAIQAYIDGQIIDNSIAEDAFNAFERSLDVNAELVIYAMDNDDSPLLAYAVEIENSTDEVEFFDSTLYIPDISKTVYIYANGDNCGAVYTEENHYMSVTSDAEISEWVPTTYQLPATYSKYYIRPGHGYDEKVPIRIEQNNDEPALYRLHDPDRNITIYQSQKLGEKKYSFPGEIVVFNWAWQASQESIIAYLNLSKVYDYYHDNLSRNSYDGKESEIRAIVGYGSIKNNAQWVERWPILGGKRIEFGSGGNEKALDTVAHEFTHAVTSSINSLGDKKEPGGLNEAYSDIMGCLIEGKVGASRWEFGEDAGLIKRYMDNPGSTGLFKPGEPTADYPATMTEFRERESQYRKIGGDNGIKYALCNVFDHASYLMMTDSRTGNVSDKQWANLFYQSMFGLTSSAKFLDARRAVIKAAQNLDFTPLQILAIQDAFYEVEIREKTDVKVDFTVSGTIIDQETNSPIQGATVKLSRESDSWIGEISTDANGGFSIQGSYIRYYPESEGNNLFQKLWLGLSSFFGSTNQSAYEHFSDHYTLQIDKDAYQNCTVKIDPSLFPSNTEADIQYSSGTIKLTPAVPNDESSDFVLARRDSSSGLTVEKAAPADIDIALLPEADALNVFLADFDFEFAYDADEYDFTDESVHEQVNILDRVMGSYFLGNEPYEWMEITPVEPDSVQIPSQWTYFVRYKSEDVDWLLRNIFNCSDDAIQNMREASGANPDGHNYYYDGGNYYKPDLGIGGSVYPFIVSAKYDGEFYHLVYDAFSEIDFPSPDSYEGRHYAVLKLKNIDGHNYWSIYQWYKSAPEKFGDVDSYSYKKASDESFWRGNYREAAEILEAGYKNTETLAIKNSLDNLKDFLQNYEDNEYHYDYLTDYYSEYPNLSVPTAVENLMGLSGFYIDAPAQIAFRQRDFYVFSSDGKMILVGGYGGYVDEGEYFIRDVDSDGVTELICNSMSTSSTVFVYRMNNGIIEESSLDYDDVERLLPAGKEAGRRAGISWYDDETKTFYLLWGRHYNDDSADDILEYHDLSPFIFKRLNRNSENVLEDISVTESDSTKTEESKSSPSSLTVANGESGGLTWSLSNSGVLTIHGAGDMPEYDSDSDGVDTPWYDMRKSITALDIKNGVTSIGSYAFFECSSLTSVTLPNSIARIGSCAFRDCTSLKKINIPDSVLNIDGWAFNGCDALKSVVVSDSAVLSETAFDESTVVNYNESWLSVANSELNGEVIRSGKIGVSDDILWSLNDEGVLRISGNGAIENYTFSYIDSIEKVNTPWWENRKDIIYVILEGNLTRIGDYAFYGLIHMARIKIPNSLESIGTGAFAGCGIQNIILPDSITNIGADAFTGCGRLTHISLPKGITSIKASTFYGCGSLSTVVIPDSVTNIGEFAFFACQSLKHIHIPNAVTSIGANAFGSCDSLISIIIPQGVKKIQYGTFWNCYALVSASIPNSVTHIAPYAFSGCYNLNNVIIPDSVVEIDYSAFEYCGFTTLKIPNSITKISNGAFHGCENLNSVTLPDSVTIIEAYAFSWCIHLANINIPDSVTEIGTDAFARCDHLKNVSIPSKAAISEGAFDNTTTVTRR